MEATIDNAGRLVIPKRLRDELGFVPGPVEVVRDGSGIRVDPVAAAELGRLEGRLIIPPSADGQLIDDDVVRSLRFADQK